MPNPSSLLHTDSVPKALTVLLADDNPESLARIRQALESAGHQVTCCSCGNDAVRAGRQQMFDLVITEIIMANGDGLELILDLKKRQPNARIIAISGGGRYLPAVECLRVAKGIGANETILKPVDVPSLAAALERVYATAVPQVA